MNPDDPRHGTNAGYMAHQNGGIAVCSDCAEGRARYERWRKYDQQLGRARIVPSLGSQRRVRSMQRLGWSLTMIAVESGWRCAEDLQWVMHNPTCNRRTARRIAETYERLSMTIPPYSSATVRARKRAIRLGYPSPLAWDDIDTDPQPIEAKDDHSQREDSVDIVVVERLLTGGGRARKLTRAEAESAVRLLLDRGLSTPQIEERYGLKTERYVRMSDRGAA